MYEFGVADALMAVFGLKRVKPMREQMTGPAPTHTKEQYLAFDLGAGDDFPAEVECRKTALVVTRVPHTCIVGRQSHEIPAGTLAYRESGKCEGKFGTCYGCLPCIDIALEPDWW